MTDLTDKVCTLCGNPPEWAEKSRGIRNAPPYSGLVCSNPACRNHDRIPDGGIGWLVDPA